MNSKTTQKSHSGLKKIWMCAALLLFSMAMTNAQTVSGTVTADGQPLPGATVLLKGTTKGASTDFDGNFTIEATPEGVLVISYIGYATKEVTVGNQTQINISLDESNELDEVVVIGYCTQRKYDLTGSVSSVIYEDLTAIPV